MTHCPMSLSNWVSGIKLWAFVIVVVPFTLGCSSEPTDSRSESEILPFPTNIPATVEVHTATTAALLTPTHTPAVSTLAPTPVAQPKATPVPTPTPEAPTLAPTSTVQPTITQVPARTPIPVVPTSVPMPLAQPTATPAPTQSPTPATPTLAPMPTAIPATAKESATNRCKELMGRGFNFDEVVVNEEVMACLRQSFSPQPTDAPTQPPPPQANSSAESRNGVNDCKELLGRGFDFDEVVANEEVMACLRQLLKP